MRGNPHLPFPALPSFHRSAFPCPSLPQLLATLSVGRGDKAIPSCKGIHQKGSNDSSRQVAYASPPCQSVPAWHSSLDAVGVEFAIGMVQPCPAWWGMRINQTRKQQTVDNHPRNTPAIPFHPSGDPSSHPAFQQPGGEGRSYSTRKKEGDQPECGIRPSLRGISSRKDNASLSKLAGTANKRFSVRPSV